MASSTFTQLLSSELCGQHCQYKWIQCVDRRHSVACGVGGGEGGLTGMGAVGREERGGQLFSSPFSVTKC